MHCWSCRSWFTLTVSDLALTGCLASQRGYSSWTHSLKPYHQSFCQGYFVLTVLRINIPRVMCNSTTIKRMLCDKVYLKWILIIQEFDDLSCIISVCCICVGNQPMWTYEVLHWFQHMHDWHSEWTTALSSRLALALQHSFTGLVPVSTPSAMALPPWSIQIISWSASLLTVVSTRKGIPRIKCK